MKTCHTGVLIPLPKFHPVHDHHARRWRRRHVGSSARVRNDNGFELREPRKEKVAPTTEEKHKYIHDGKEYNRPPNLFDVGGGELKLLPEVLSGLSFETRDFKDEGTAVEQKALRDSRPWGRLHIDGWPAPIQYLRYIYVYGMDITIALRLQRKERNDGRLFCT